MARKPNFILAHPAFSRVRTPHFDAMFRVIRRSRCGSINRIFRQYSDSPSAEPLRVCVVGSGPAGCYAAEKMLKRYETARVDVIDRLATPFGLVRSGVAPDHPETKIVLNQFTRVCRHERCSFLGNISLGSSVSLPELQDLYHVVILAYGAESDRALGIQGEDLAGIYSAREFVWWYNGHPDCSDFNPDLKDIEIVVILGQGNVALDAARILLRPTEELSCTDIANHAIVSLRESSVRKVKMAGRRGPAQAACTAKELREVLGINDLRINIKESDLVTTPADEEVLKNDRIRRRVYELLSKAVASKSSGDNSSQRELEFIFFRKPNMFLDSNDRPGHVSAVQFEKTALRDDGSGKQMAIGTGEFEDTECQMVLKSIGYKSISVKGLPFDHRAGVVPNTRGRVLSDASGNSAVPVEGLYVCGWLKRGPTGIIATNLYCAEETVSSISEDIDRGVLARSSQKPGTAGLLELLGSRDVRVVPYSGWEKIDAEEKRLGALQNKPREKLTTWNELLRVAGA
ncbi:hypothetical protein MLD38_014785 [Melastoma candidum]|uniref:Uncharacterized protein n=1 Tax=Melastoma candidum TaxID=119954 RepID=A0ACB9RE00_9MYRT|nr:hypothetical protein MLD38_014785 [Melastoma candidum]